MFLHKKIAKVRQWSISHQNQPISTIIHEENKKKTRRCQFKEIPPHSKYLQENSLYTIYGDFVFTEKDGSFVTEISLLNQIKFIQDVTISEEYHQQVITARLSQRDDTVLPAWSEFVDKLNGSSEPESQEWGKVVKHFCHTYSKVMQRQSRKKMKSEPRKKFFADVTFNTEQQKKVLFELYPCLQMKFRLKNHHNQLKEIMYSEKFVKELGHSSDSFVSTLFNEGIPQLMQFDNPLARDVIRPLIENYFTVADTGSEISEFETRILCKDNSVRNMRFKTFCFMNYETNTFGMDIVLAVTATGEPILCSGSVVKQKLDLEFTQNMVLKEGESDHFLSLYYDQNFEKILTETDKTCLVRELYVEEEL